MADQLPHAEGKPPFGWLDNTALSFDQIAEFCKLHPLEVSAIADGDSAQGIKGLDPNQHRSAQP